DERLSVDEIAGFGAVSLDAPGITPPDGNDLTAGQERAGHPNRLIQQAARVVAQVKNVAFVLVRRYLRRERLECLLKLAGRPGVELRKPDISDVIAFDPLTHHADLDHLPGQRESECPVLAHDLKSNLGARRTAHFFDCFADRETFRGNAI